MADSINTPSKRYQAAIGAWTLVDDLENRETMRQAGRRRLPQLPAESDTRYVIRLNGARLVPALYTAIEALSGRLKESNVEPDTDAPARLVEWFWANGLQSYLDTLALDGLKYGQSHLWIDSDGTPYHVPAKDMLEFFPTSGNPVYCRFRRNVEEPGDVVRYRIYEVTIDSIKIYESIDDADYSLIEQIDSTLSFVPLLTFQYSDKPYKPYFQSLAELNEAHWQSYAYQVHALSYSRFTIYVARGINNDDMQVSQISPCTMFLVPTDAGITMLEGGGAGIEAGVNDLKELERQMAELSARPLMPDNSKSATEVNRSATSQDAPIKRLAQMQIDMIGAALRMAGDILGVPGEWNATGKVDFTPINPNSQDVAQLLQAFATGLIDAQTARIAMKASIPAMREISLDDISARADGGSVTQTIPE